MSTQQFTLPDKQTVYFKKEEHKEHVELAHQLQATSTKDYLIKLYENRRELSEQLQELTAENATLKQEKEAQQYANNDLLETIAEKSRKLYEMEEALELLAKWEGVKLRLADFRAETETAFKNLFGDENFSGLTVFDLIDLMHDYTLRDPSNEFPFEPVARKIYERITAQKNEATPSEQPI